MRNDPWSTMRAMMDEMDRWARTGLGRRGQELADALGYLPLDVAETADAYILSAELPGVTMDAVSVNVEDNVITITGTKPAPEDTETVKYHRIERPYGNFQRSLALPRNVDPDQVSAKYETGVLTITVGKREEAKPKRIEIQAGP
ncbi:MAG: Hsp20/alpha crystallin family protein [Armatimonadetes bacterium]|nr:Hsp20/alpha crystallin family protein [Armatimonadota bacterium]